MRNAVGRDDGEEVAGRQPVDQGDQVAAGDANGNVII